MSRKYGRRKSTLSSFEASSVRQLFRFFSTSSRFRSKKREREREREILFFFCCYECIECSFVCTHWFLVSYSPDFSSLTSIRRKRKISTRFFRRNIETRSLSLCFSNLLHDICCFPYPVCHSYSTSFTHKKNRWSFEVRRRTEERRRRSSTSQIWISPGIPITTYVS